MSNKPVKLSEYDAIEKTIQHYINGVASGSGKEMKYAFQQDATIFAINERRKV